MIHFKLFCSHKVISCINCIHENCTGCSDRSAVMRSGFNVMLNIPLQLFTFFFFRMFFTLLVSSFLIPDIWVRLFSLPLLYSEFPVSSHKLTTQLPSEIPLSFCSLLCSVLLSHSSVRGYTGWQRLLGGWRLMLK